MLERATERRSKKTPVFIRGLSEFFYHKANVKIGLLFTAIFLAYLLLVMLAKATGFEVTGSTIKSLGTSFGFDQADIREFLAARSDNMIEAYIRFNQIWDTLFGLTYGLMYVVWVSVLFKPLAHKTGLLNLLPLVQVLFDWLENYQLAVIAKQYLADGLIASSNAQLASVFSMIKWACSGLTYLLILVGIVMLIARALGNKK